MNLDTDVNKISFLAFSMHVIIVSIDDFLEQSLLSLFE